MGHHVYSIFVMPRLIYGLQILLVSPYNIAVIKDSYRKTLRQIRQMPKSTGKPAIYLLIGSLLVEAEAHIKTVTFFQNALCTHDSNEYQLIHG